MDQNQRENIKDYSNLKVTTMTIVVSLTQEVDKRMVFNFLPWVLVPIEQKPKAKKIKLPHCKIPGAILNLRFGNQTRGIRVNKSKPFKNAVTMTISTRVKNINLKLSSSSVQMCGASSIADGTEAVEHLLYHIEHIQHMIDYIQSHQEEATQIVQWLTEQMRGEPCERHTEYIRDGEGLALRVINTSNDFYIRNLTAVIPTSFNTELVNFFLSFFLDHKYFSDLQKKWMYAFRNIRFYNAVPHISSVSSSMVNYNYSLDFKVDRQALCTFINKNNGFLSRYNNAISQAVTVEMVYNPPPNSIVKKRKNKIPHHTFLIYRSGAVTQSGPSIELMEEVYYQFMETISNIKPNILLGVQE